MRAKECFRRCEAGILRSLRQARPNKKAERRLKQCGVARPREPRHPAAARETCAPPKKKTATKKAASAVGARAQARAEAVWAAAARAPSTAADAWAAGRALRGDQGPQARRRKTSGRARREDPAPQAQSEKSARRRSLSPRPSLGSRRSPRSSRGGRAPTRGATRRATSGRAASAEMATRAPTNTTRPRDRGHQSSTTRRRRCSWSRRAARRPRTRGRTWTFCCGTRVLGPAASSLRDMRARRRRATCSGTVASGPARRRREHAPGPCLL